MYHIIKNGDERYKDLGEDRADPKVSQANRLVRKLQKLGYKVQLTELNA